MLRKLLSALAITALVGLPFFAQAADFKTGSDQELTINDREVVKDLYVANKNVTVNADVKGDLVAAGTSLLLNGAVENSLFAAGGNVTSRSNVNHNARIAGNNVTISGGNVLGDLLIAGNKITISKDTVIGGDLLVAGNQITIDGTVKGITKIAGTDVTINGKVEGVTVYAKTLKIGSTAVITKDVDYHGQNTAKVEDGAELSGMIKFTKVANQNYGALTGFMTIWSMLLTLIGSVLLAMLIIKLTPKFIKDLTNNMFSNTMVNLGYGLVLLFLVPICLIISAILMVGLPVAGFGLALLLPMFVLGTIVGKIALGSWILKLFHQQDNYQPTYFGALIGVLAVTVLGIIPLIGFMVITLIYLVAWGSLFGYFLKFLRDQSS